MVVMRLFVSLPLPSPLSMSLESFLDVRRDVDRSAARERGGSADWSWSLSDQWHLTLAFAGDVPVDRQHLWAEELADVAARTEPFELELAGAGAFPHPDRAKVLFLRASAVTDQGMDPLGHLARATRTAAHRVGVDCDGKPFTPHVTLARSARGVSATRWLRVVDTFIGPRWPVAGFDLVESQWAGHGSRAVHRVLERYEFGIAPA